MWNEVWYRLKLNLDPYQNEEQNIQDLTWLDYCKCGKQFKDHNVQDLHDCELTSDENQRGLLTEGKKE